jgi:alkylation response protein AidB-like acyl-CoA dehydrogenase
LQDEIKSQGLWAIFLDEELGGPGYGQLKLGLLNEIIGRYPSAPQMFGAAAPDTGNMEMLAAYGTEVQKERWLKPMLNQEMWSAYSMTEPQGGSDPNLFKTHAARDGDEWVINGEKWFTSAGALLTFSSSRAPTACSSCSGRRRRRLCLNAQIHNPPSTTMSGASDHLFRPEDAA